MCTRVLALLALYAGLAHSFSWDIVVGGWKTLEFYYNGTVTHVEDIPSAHVITAVTYDPVHFRVLFADYHNIKLSIYSFDITTRKIQTLVMRQTNYSARLAYDPLTQLLFWTEYNKIYSLSLKPASSNEAVDGNLIVTSDYYCEAIAVDSCGGYVYWTTNYKIERAAFDGSEREVLIDGYVDWRTSLAIDQQTAKMYWTEKTTYPYQVFIQSADLNGKNRKTFYFIASESIVALTVSKDFIYWRSTTKEAIWQLPKHQQHDVAPVVYSQSGRHCWECPLTAANYTIEEQTLGIKSCEALRRILGVEEHHGSICHNYCFQGNCSVSAEGHPKCSCDRGYSGERCDVSICKDYCLQGNCSVSTEGQRTCSCDRGYSGERCQVSACHKHCFNDGVCSLNEAQEPVCQCTGDYEGERCHVATTHTGACVCADNMTQQILLAVKQVREDLLCTLQMYTDKLDENEAKLQICEESRNDDQQNYDATMSKPQTSSMKL